MTHGRSRKSRTLKEHSMVPHSLETWGMSTSPKLPIIYLIVKVQREEKKKKSTQDSLLEAA